MGQRDARSGKGKSGQGSGIFHQHDPARFTPNARYYFKPQTLGDYRTSLSKLGPLTAITPAA